MADTDRMVKVESSLSSPATKSAIQNVLGVSDKGAYTNTTNIESGVMIPMQLASNFTADGVHPNAAGYAALANALRPYISLEAGA